MIERSHVEAVLSRIRPFLQADGADIELADVGTDCVSVRLIGLGECEIAPLSMHMGSAKSCASRFLISPSCDSCDATSLLAESYPGATRVDDDRVARSLRCLSGAEPTWTRPRGPLTGADRP